MYTHSSSNKDHKIIRLSTNFFLQCPSQCTFLYSTHTIALVGERRPTVWHIALISICHKSVWDCVFYCRTGRQRQRQRGMSEKTETECRGFILRFGIWERIFSCLSVCQTCCPPHHSPPKLSRQLKCLNLFTSHKKHKTHNHISRHELVEMNANTEITRRANKFSPNSCCKLFAINWACN